MNKKALWLPLLVGVIGIVTGAVWMLWRGGSLFFGWPVPAVAQRVMPSVTVVLNQQAGPHGSQIKGIGTGVILNRAGDIVTNNHVVAGARQITVVLSNGRRYVAKVVGTDSMTDLAVLRIPVHSGLVPIRFANSGRIRPGDLVVAIGNSLGLTRSVTVGVVSAKERILHHDGWGYSLIQTDAAINPGNSGGPLVNIHGRLIGINSSKIAQAGVEGIGFAIPSDVVANVVQQILRYGYVQRPWMGMTLQSGPTGAPGLLVVAVTPHGPAAAAGIQAGDFVTGLSGRPVTTLADVGQFLAMARIGQQVQVRVLRGGQALGLTMRLGVQKPVAVSPLPTPAHG